jgi:glutaminase
MSDTINPNPNASPFHTYLHDLHSRFADDDSGAVADYIPQLFKANPKNFGISVVTTKGTVYDVGVCDKTFTIQSISKAFMYGMALEDNGRAKILERIGVEPTGNPFNSMIKLDEQSHRPHNPMVNAGAIATASLIQGIDPPTRLNRVLDMFEVYAGRRLDVDMAVYSSEKTAGHRNRSIAHLMLNFGMITPNIEEILDLYFQQCSILVNAHDLAVMGATLANDGINPINEPSTPYSSRTYSALCTPAACTTMQDNGPTTSASPQRAASAEASAQWCPGKWVLDSTLLLSIQKATPFAGLKCARRSRTILDYTSSVHGPPPIYLRCCLNCTISSIPKLNLTCSRNTFILDCIAN